MKAQHRCYKLSSQKLRSVREHYEDFGWKITWIAVYFKIHHSAIQYQIRSKGWTRRAKVLQVLPKEVMLAYREIKKQRYINTTYNDTKEKKIKLKEGSYEYIGNLAEQQRLKNCQHIRWIKRCSFCGKILESDAINHQL